MLNNRILRIIQDKDRFVHTDELYNSYNILPIEKLFKHKLLLFAHAQYFHSSSLPILFHHNLPTNSQIHDHDTRSKSDFHINLPPTNIGTRAINYLSSKIWNSLPTDLKNIQSKNIFKKSSKLFLRQSETD
jgi:hypothetical protein